MLKVRLMGTTNDIKWFRKMMEKDKRIHLLGASESFPIKNSKKYKRMYLEVEKKTKG